MPRGGRVVVDRAAVDDFVGGFAQRALTEAAEVVLQGAKRRCPTSPAGSVDPQTGVAHPSGWLRSSINARVINVGTNTWVAIIGTPVSYAHFVEYGTKPHVIRAVRAHVLANTRTGQVFGKEVHHPGTKAQPFLRPALDDLAGRRFGGKQS